MMLKRFSDLRNLQEGYKNFIGLSSEEQRREWADRVWAQLQKTYAPIGGIKGSGFQSTEDMIQKIPFWKIYVEGDKVLVTVMYKDKAGRKTVAASTDGSNKGKKILEDILFEGLKTGWGEQSKAMLNFVMTRIGFDTIKPFLIKFDEVKKILKGEEIFKIRTDDIENLSVDDRKVYNMYKNLLSDYFYLRKIGDIFYLKVSLGTPNNRIK